MTHFVRIDEVSSIAHLVMVQNDPLFAPSQNVPHYVITYTGVISVDFPVGENNQKQDFETFLPWSPNVVLDHTPWSKGLVDTRTPPDLKHPNGQEQRAPIKNKFSGLPFATLNTFIGTDSATWAGIDDFSLAFKTVDVFDNFSPAGAAEVPIFVPVLTASAVARNGGLARIGYHVTIAGPVPFDVPTSTLFAARSQAATGNGLFSLVPTQTPKF